MKRFIEKTLIAWKDKPDRLPLILRGARQVGKSYTVEQFGKENFTNTVVVNFEESPVLASAFETFEIPRILRTLAGLTSQEIIPGSTLLFLDEIQLCVPALKALRYFREKLPSLHVIAAGSFLEFVLEDENEVSFPVGRAQFCNMMPLSFVEFLYAIGQSGLHDIIVGASLENPVPQAIHEHLLRFVRDFFFIGGMPHIVDKFAQNQSFLDCQHAQSAILGLYRLDLAKYSKKQQYKNLHILFDQIPEFVGRHFKYSKIDSDSSNPARDYKNALHKLELARLIHKVSDTHANGLPLRAEVDSNKFKVFFLDVGLLQYALEIDTNDLAMPLADIHRGALAEQFVAQELLAYTDPYIEKHLFFWERAKKGSSAEIDFLISLSGKIVPIEVKAGKSGRLRSLQQFLAAKPSKVGVKISEAPLSFEHNILSVPFYLISEMSRLLFK